MAAPVAWSPTRRCTNTVKLEDLIKKKTNSSSDLNFDSSVCEINICTKHHRLSVSNKFCCLWAFKSLIRTKWQTFETTLYTVRLFLICSGRLFQSVVYCCVEQVEWRRHTMLQPLPLVRVSLNTGRHVIGPFTFTEDGGWGGGGGGDVESVHCCWRWNTLWNVEATRWGGSPPFWKAFS